MKLMKAALDEAGLKPYLMIQPLAYMTHDIEHRMAGYMALPEAPYALEVRNVTRFEAASWARDCYEAGIHYIGGCCGFEPFHIRAMAEELSKERNKIPEVTQENGFLLDGLKGSLFPFYKNRKTIEYWKSLVPTTCRPHSAAYAQLDLD